MLSTRVDARIAIFSSDISDGKHWRNPDMHTY